MFKKILILIVSLLTIVGVYLYPTISQTLNTATGFSAKNICSGHFISGFSGELVMQEALIPLNDTFSHVNFKINTHEKLVKTNVFGLFERTAHFEKGIGCTLAAVNKTDSFQSIQVVKFHSSQLIKPLITELIFNSENSGVNQKKLNKALIEAFKEPNPKKDRRTKAIVVMHNGKVIVEKYSNDVNENTPLLSWSMAKSITNMQVGLLVKDGLLDIYSAANVPSWNSLKDEHKNITVDQLLRMSSGLEFLEIYGIGSDAARMLSVEASASLFAENKPVIYKPDTHWAYSSGTSNIISGIIKRTIGGTEQDYYEYTQNKLFKPLEITSAQLETDASGTLIGSSYAYLSAKDWAKLGQLYLQKGVWNGVQLLPKGWVNYSITPTETNPLNHYGAHFWLNKNPISSDKKRVWPSVPEEAYYMSGFQGQAVVIIPSKNLVIVRLGFTTPGTNKGIEELIAGVIASIYE